MKPMATYLPSCDPIAEGNRQRESRETESQARDKEVSETIEQYKADPGMMHQFLGAEIDYIDSSQIHDARMSNNLTVMGFLLEQAFIAYCESEAERQV